MAGYRKLGRTTSQRKAMLKGLVTSLLENGRVETTETRAKEVRKIAEKLISSAVREADNFSSRQVKVTKARLDSGGRKITISATLAYFLFEPPSTLMHISSLAPVLSADLSIVCA